MEITSSELLEEMLKRGQQAVLPTLRKSAERFVDIFNHSTTQKRMREKLQSAFHDRYFDELRQIIDQCKSATTLFDKLKNLKELLETIETKITENDLTPFLTRLYDTGFIGLITEENLDFLTSDDLNMEERVEKFIHYLEHGGKNKETLKNAFEEYIRTWKENKRKYHLQRLDNWNENEVMRAEKEMRANFDEALLENRQFISQDQLIRDLKEKFEPLRHKLVDAKTKSAVAQVTATSAGIGLIVATALTGGIAAIPLAIVGVSSLAAGQKVKNEADRKLRSNNPRWYDDVSDFITEYLNNRKTDNELKGFLDKEELESDLHHFVEYADPWLDEMNRKITEFESMIKKSFFLPKELILKEIDRMWKFLYAVLLNKPGLIEEHKGVLDDMIQDAANLESPDQKLSLIPSISFGQLPIPGGKEERVVTIKFVLNKSPTHENTAEIMQKLQSLFKNVESSCKKMENGVNIIEMKLRIDDNVSATVARCISNLADLKIRGVLIGDFGLGGFRHAMNPAFNRIYSLNAIDKAEGFMATYFPGSLNRGGEPYFCPNGWRRYSIDVGLTGSEFEAKYKDWHVAYHGTDGHIAMAILLNGVRASGHGCFLNAGEGAVYLSPSIEYSGHPRYSRVWQVKGKYAQMVLQVRVDRKLVFEKKQGTLPGAFPDDEPMDRNFGNNDQLEWVIKWPPGTSMTALNGILVYGIMLRVTDQPPENLPQNAWWKTP